MANTESGAAAKCGASIAVPIWVLALAGCGTGSSADGKLPTLTRETLPSVKNDFNAGVDRPRAIVFFSSSCAACDTGSAALQEMLDKLPVPLTLFAVWEPIAAKDKPPTSHMLGNLKDARVHQLWDPSHIISDEMRAAELAHPGSPPQARTRWDPLESTCRHASLSIL